MITVIADDITGAAEIAGIAKSAGARCRLLIVRRAEDVTEENLSPTLADVLVLATDTRQMPEAEAVALVAELARRLQGCTVFKKVDSALRGHLLAESGAIIGNTEYERLLLVPQNPSKGRVVRGGLYYIKERLLHETAFAHDPEFPALSSDVSRFGVPDAESEEDIDRLVAKADERTLLAGGADLFKAFLKRYSFGYKEEAGVLPPPKSLMVVCGSTQSTAVIDAPLCRHFRCVEKNIPEAVFQGLRGAEEWLADVRRDYPGRGVVLTISRTAQGGRDFALRLRRTVAEVVGKAYEPGGLLVIEGGATAFEALSALGYGSLSVVREHSPGVVELANSEARVILKPGSYPWGGLLDGV